MPLPVGKTEVKGGSLTIKNLRPADSGLYECVATNSMGTKKAVMNLVVQEARGLYCFKSMPVYFTYVKFCKDHRDKTEVPDPLAVENLISYKLNNTRE